MAAHDGCRPVELTGPRGKLPKDWGTRTAPRSTFGTFHAKCDPCMPLHGFAMIADEPPFRSLAFSSVRRQCPAAKSSAGRPRTHPPRYGGAGETTEAQSRAGWRAYFPHSGRQHAGRRDRGRSSESEAAPRSNAVDLPTSCQHLGPLCAPLAGLGRHSAQRITGVAGVGAGRVKLPRLRESGLLIRRRQSPPRCAEASQPRWPRFRLHSDHVCQVSSTRLLGPGCPASSSACRSSCSVWLGIRIQRPMRMCRIIPAWHMRRTRPSWSCQRSATCFTVSSRSP